VSLIGLGLFSEAIPIGEWMGDRNGSHTYAIVVCLIAMWILNIGLNVVQAAGWTLVLDVCAADQQQQGNAIVSFLSSGAGVICNVLGFINLAKFFPFFGSNAQAVFYIGMVCVLLSCIPTFIVGKEVPYKPIPDGTVNNNGTQSSSNFFTLTWGALKKMSNEVVRILIVFFFSNAAYTPLVFYYTNYMGEIMGGDGSAAEGTAARALYDKGVQYGALALAINGAISALYSLVIHHMVRWFGVKKVYLFGQIVGTICLLCPLFQFTSFGKSDNFLVLCVGWAACLGILNATINSIPYALLGMTVSKEDTGLYMGILNSAQVVAQMVASFSITTMMSAFNSAAAGMVVGAIFGFIGCFLIFILKVNENPVIVDETEKLLSSTD